jgi:hypothetical protein
LIARRRNRQGNYVRKLDEATARVPLKPGEVRHISVVHDNWCSLIAGKGPCDCNPSIEILGREQ